MLRRIATLATLSCASRAAVFVAVEGQGDHSECRRYTLVRACLKFVEAQLLCMLLQDAEQLRVLDAGHLQHLRSSVADVSLIQGSKKAPEVQQCDTPVNPGSKNA
jgi:hypothetical protein